MRWLALAAALCAAALIPAGPAGIGVLVVAVLIVPLRVPGSLRSPRRSHG
jgi:hypothetical protein